MAGTGADRSNCLREMWEAYTQCIQAIPHLPCRPCWASTSTRGVADSTWAKSVGALGHGASAEWEAIISQKNLSAHWRRAPELPLSLWSENLAGTAPSRPDLVLSPNLFCVMRHLLVAGELCFQLETSARGLQSPSSSPPTSLSIQLIPQALSLATSASPTGPKDAAITQTPKVLYYIIRKEGDPEMLPGCVPLCNILVSTRRRTGAEADALFTQFWQHLQRG